jgi:CRISPR-associated endonuclease/helicase Cas3
LQPAVELAGNKQEVAQLFKQCNRYQLIFDHRKPQSLDQFIESLIPRVMGWLEKQQRPLITLNTRASAKKVWQALNKHFGENIPVYLISADLIPRDRLQKIAAIKTGEPCIVISTQTIEAGVDIDMDVVIRDFAPLDALIQIAGRCNRNFKQGEQGGFVEIVSLVSKNGRKYAEYVYDRTILDVTRDSLNPLEKTAEDEILPLISGYFKLLKQRKNTGESLTKEFAYWKEMEDVHSILRPQGEQIAFLVIDDEEGQQLVKQLQHALAIEERWEKRRTLQSFAAELNKRTVAVYNHKDFYPEKYINRNYLELFKDHGYAILKAEYYDTQQGITLPLDEDDPAVSII